jgi:hypothetical protein
MPARYGIGRRSAQDARSLPCTILGDASATKPPLIPYNPAIRPRNRRRTGRRLARAPQDRPSSRSRAAASLGHAAAGVIHRRAGRAAVRPRR